MNRVPSAVLFSGIRGTGKTTAARLFAKALNCLNPDNGDCCGSCSHCEEIAAGAFEDVIEIDGASNTGVDDIRSLQESMAYHPVKGAYKVYIIDEVHMLSQSAFNALLKTLEEPPERVRFVFATTEVKKVPDTILSRCQVFYLRRFSRLELTDRMSEILKKEGISFEEKALDLIAEQGHGSMRDALTLLDQAIAIGAGTIGAKDLEGYITHSDIRPFLDLLVHMLHKDVDGLTKDVLFWQERASDLKGVVEKTLQIVRHAFVLRELPQHKIPGVDEDEKARIIELAQQFDLLDLNRIFRIFLRTLKDMTGGDLDSIILENTLLEWCLDPGLPQTASVQQAERQPKRSSSQQVSPIRHESREPKATSQLPTIMAPTQKQDEPVEFPSSWRSLVEMYKREEPLLGRYLEETHLETYDAHQIEISCPSTAMAASKLGNKDVKNGIEQVFRTKFGFNGKLAIRLTDESPANESIVTQKRDEEKARRSDVETSLREAAFTKRALESFKGEIESISWDKP